MKTIARFFFLLSFFSCSSQLKHNNDQKDIYISIFEKIINDSNYHRYQYGNEQVIISVLFYNIGVDNFMLVGPVPYYSEKYSRGYIESDHFLLQYIGINDSLANVFLPLTDLKTDYPINGYTDDHVPMEWDVPAKTYLIHGKDSISVFQPDKVHSGLLERKLQENGQYWLPPPPPSLKGN